MIKVTGAASKRAEARLREAAAKWVREWLRSEGNRFLKLDPESETKSGFDNMTATLGVSWAAPGGAEISRTFRRTFYTDKATAVPAVLADRFLDVPEIIEVVEAEKK